MRYIIKIKDCYFEWSTISDRPVSYGLTAEQMKEYQIEELQRKFEEDVKKIDEWLPKDLEKADRQGSSAWDSDDLEDAICCNRAGENEKN